MALKIYIYVGYFYHCICVLATVILISWSIYLYHLNDDVAKIDYKTFHGNKDQIYPSVSLCFGNIFIDEKLRKYGVDQDSYLKFLKGEIFSQTMLSINYRNVTTDLEEFLLGILFEQELDYGEVNPNQTYWYDNTKDSQVKSWRPHYYVDHFNPYYGTIYKCLAVDVPYIPNEHFNWISVVMKKSVFHNNIRPYAISSNLQSTGFFSVQISYPNQRLRYSTEKHTWNVLTMNGSYGTRFNIHGMEVMRRRNKAREPCNCLLYTSDAADE